MHDQLTAILESADSALAGCGDFVDEKKVVSARATVARARLRLSFPENVAVVAFAGGTGSGKSSLVNALAGEDVADVGGIRPTTSSPLAVISPDVAEPIAGYLDALGVEKRQVVDGEGLCLIDLPDSDSVEVEHRHQVEELIPQVDVLVLVFDPEKYKDASIHDGLIGQNIAQAEHFVFILNQTDRLDPSSVDQVTADLESALREDGVADPDVLAVAASPLVGPASGLESVRARIGKVAGRTPGKSRWIAEIVGAIQETIAAVGEPSPGFEIEMEGVLGEATQRLVAGDTAGAGEAIRRYLDATASTLSGVARTRVFEIIAAVPGQISTTMAQLPDPGTRLKTRSRSSSADVPVLDRELIERSLTESIIDPVRSLLARWAAIGESLGEVVTALGGLRPIDR